MLKYSQLLLVVSTGLILGQPWLGARAEDEEFQEPRKLPSALRLVWREGDFQKVPILGLLNSPVDRRIKLLGRPIDGLWIEYQNRHMSAKWIVLNPSKTTVGTIRKLTRLQVLQSDLLSPRLKQNIGRVPVMFCPFPAKLDHQTINDFLEGKTDYLPGFDARTER